MRVFIYFNLHRHCLSVRAIEGQHKGRVIAHCRAAHIDHAQFKVSEAGRLRVIKERKKNVHAGIEGELRGMSGVEKRGSELWLDTDAKEYDDLPALCGDHHRITYNPYRFDSFVEVDTFRPIHNSAQVRINGREVYAIDQLPVSGN